MGAHHQILEESLQLRTKITILAVEDDSLSMAFLESQIKGLGHNILKAENGEEAINILKKNSHIVDVVLMDREMPVMDGLTAVKQIKDNKKLCKIPIIMVTSADTPAEIKEGLDAGVFYYLTKPVDEEMMDSVMSAAVRDAKQSQKLSQELLQHKASFDMINTVKFHFQTLSDAESLAAFAAHCFPDPERALQGVGNLLINAIEHGNLGIGYDRKSDLIETNMWRAEVNRLQMLPEHINKVATATITKKDNGVYFIVEDQGQGFIWQDYLAIDPARAGDNHGRGIAQANAISFDKLTYNETGTKAVAFVGRSKQLEW